MSAPPRASLLDAERLELLRRRVGARGDAAIPRLPEGAEAPLSFGQERLWFLEQLAHRPLYHVPATLVLRGHLDVEALGRALDEVVRRHEALRTSFPTVDRGPRAAVAPLLRLGPAVEDLQGLSPDERLPAARRVSAEAAARPFDLGAGPLVRARLLRLGPREHVLALVVHHIVCDWWSIQVLLSELGALYAAFAAGQPSTLPDLAIRYGDFAAWQRRELTADRLQADVRYWGERLAGAPAALALPADRPRPRVKRYRGRWHVFLLPPRLAGALGALCRDRSATPFQALLAAFVAVLRRYSGSADVVVGTPVTGRTRRELQPLIGFFLNTLALRVDLAGDPPFAALLARVREVALEATAHQELPFEQLVDALRAPRDLGSTPLFQVLFAVSEATAAPATWPPGLGLDVIPTDTGSAKFDLSLVMVHTPEGLWGTFEYDADLFDPGTVERMAGHLARLLEAALPDPERRVSQLPMLAPGERRLLVEGWNATRAPHEPGARLHALVEGQAARTPDAVAVRVPWRPEASLTYRALEARANRLAHRLRRLGAGPERLVGVCLERGPDLVVALLAALKAGAAYVPLDPDHPRERLAAVAADARPSAVVTVGRLADRLPEPRWPVVLLDRDAGAAEPPSRPAGAVQPDGLCYVIHTSGSTGRPKGVMVGHRAICNRLRWMQDAYRLTPADVVLQKTPFSFDVSVWELFWPLIAGASLVLARPGGHRDAEYLRDLVAAAGVTVLHFVPSMLDAFLEVPGLEAAGAALRLGVCSGEALTGAQVERWRSRLAAPLHNLYGPTEAAVDVSAHACGPAEGPVVPIGVPVANTSLHVLDADLGPVPVGVAGELCIGGVQLARGYLGRPDLTAERFVPDPFSRAGRLYRTGDRARRRADGEIEYLGRLDRQVKVRGHRVELGEVEAALASHPQVRRAAVLAPDGPAGPRLVAYVAAGEPVSDGALRDHLRERLPEAMVPADYVVLERLPLTPSGKVDHRALPLPVAARSRRGFVAPRSPVEAALAAVCAEVLGLGAVGVEDNFFELGGDSIRTVRYVGLARQAGLELTVQQLFDHQTVAELAAHVSLGEPPTQPAPPSEPFGLVAAADRALLPDGLEDAYPLTSLQAGMLFHMQERSAAPAYHNVTAIHVRARFDAAALRAAAAAVVARHPVLRTSFDLASCSEPLQLVHAAAELPIDVIDPGALPPGGGGQGGVAEAESAVERFLDAEADRPLDLAAPPLLRATVHRSHGGTFWLSLTECHAILDGWSFTSIVGEIFGAYDALLRGEPVPAPPPAVTTFRDFVAAEREAARSEAHRAFWTGLMAGAAPLRLPPCRTDPAGAPAKGHQHRRYAALPDAVCAGLDALCRSLGVPLSTALLAAHLKVLGVLADQDDVLTGTIGHSRLETADSDRVRGLFLNTLPFRLRLGRGPWTDLVARVFAAQRAALPHRMYPMAAIQREHGTEPMFETAFNYLHFYSMREATRLRDVELVSTFRERARTSIPVMATFERTLHQGQPGLVLAIICEAERFSASQVDEISALYQRVLAEMVAGPQRDHAGARLLDPEDERRQLGDWNRTAVAYGEERLLHQLVEARAAEAPDAVALRFEGRSLTYGELDGSASRLAGDLRRLGVGPETLVGLCLERSFELVVALLAVMRAGAAYLPLDPEHPPAGLARLVEDSGAALVLSREVERQALPELAVPVVLLDGVSHLEGEGWGGGATLSADRRHWPAEGTPGVVPPTPTLPLEGGGSSDPVAGNAAYVLHTSGSTGRPKGVVIDHAGFRNRILWMQATFPLGPGDAVLQKTPLTFDVSGWELLWPLVAGARMVLARPGGHRDPGYLADLVAAERVTTLHFVPSMLRPFLAEPGLEERCASLRRVFVSGEAVSAELRDRALRRLPAELHDLYGPTEASIDVSWWPCVLEEGPAVPIGRPIANCRLHVVGRAGGLVPAGTAGELCIGGVGLARCYVGRPDLTAASFVPDPFGAEPGGRLYRTGDLARHRSDGALEFLGRADRQVKIRGRRVEPGEVEAALREHPAVGDCAVVALPDEASTSRLVAYLVGAGGAEPDVADVREFLGRRLPRHLVPAAFAVLPALPVTAHGKLDERALPAAGAGRRDAGPGPVYAEPVTAAERLVARVWGEVLGVAAVGLHDDFFALGGDSISSLQVVARLAQHELRVSPDQVFEHPTVAALAAVARRGAAVADQGPVTGDVPLTPIQRWFFERHVPAPERWNQAFLVRVPEGLDSGRLAEALRHVTLHHDALRHRFVPSGGGWRQVAGTADADVPLGRADLAGLQGPARRRRLAAEVERAQAGLRLAGGPLLRAAHVELGPGHGARLLLVVHHLVVDVVSWRILSEDLLAAYRQLGQGGPVRLPPKAASFQRWAQRLAGHDAGAELGHWRAVAARSVAPLPVDCADGANDEGWARAVRVHLDRRRTRMLLADLPAAARAQPAEALLAALLVAFQRWTGRAELLVDLEGHGREPFVDDVDVSRTVGWFTSLYPVVLESPPVGGVTGALRAVKDTLRQVPGGGLGYGVLRYLRGEPALCGHPDPEVSFNYAGSLDQLGAGSALARAPESSGRARDRRAARAHLIDVDAAVSGGRLEANWTYASRRHRRETVAALAGGWLRALEQLVDACLRPGAATLAPSDFPAASLRQDELDELVAEYGEHP